MTENFQLENDKLWKRLKKHSVMTLSTTAHGRVSSRAMSVVSTGEKFYFQTDKKSLKCEQLAENPNAALSLKNYSIEGICRCIGRPNDEGNKFFILLFNKYFHASCVMYSKLPDEILFEFTPSLIYSWGYEFNKPFMEYWNFTEKSYRKLYK